VTARLLHDFVAAQAARQRHATAVVMRGDRLSYGELESASNRLARVLLATGCRPGDRVCLASPKSPWTIVGMLATLKIGGIYVPLDVASPPARVARIVVSADPACILASGDAAERLIDKLGSLELLQDGPRIGWLDRSAPTGAAFGLDAILRASEAPVPGRGAPQDPAHILFTSGSTGEPKGVVITHANVLAFVEWAMRRFGTVPSDRVSGHSPFHFDLSTFDIYGAFAAGAQLHLVPPDATLSPKTLAEFIRESELTQFFAVPTALAYMARFDVVRTGDFPALKRLLWCGEVLPTPVLAYFMRRLPHVEFTNLYGPTEATIASSHHTVRQCPSNEQEPIPIGSACDGEELLVLDDDLAPVAPGTIGQLYIRGVGLSPGYWRDPEKSRDAFVTQARDGSAIRRAYRTGDLAKIGDDGLVRFVGRADSQIKSRGYRIELGEIEAAANTLEGLIECAVVAVETHDFDGHAICLAYVCARATEVTPPRLREQLASLLPAYMLPSRWLRLDVLPKNQNGKIDRRALEKAFRP